TGKYAKTLGGNFLVMFVLLCAPALLLARARDERVDGLLRLSVPTALVGVVLITGLSSASRNWSSTFVGIAPLVIAVVLWWWRRVEGGAGTEVVRPLSAGLIGVLVGMLFWVAMYDTSPWRMHHAFVSGPYAG